MSFIDEFDAGMSAIKSGDNNGISSMEQYEALGRYKNRSVMNTDLIGRFLFTTAAQIPKAIVGATAQTAKDFGVGAIEFMGGVASDVGVGVQRVEDLAFGLGPQGEQSSEDYVKQMQENKNWIRDIMQVASQTYDIPNEYGGGIGRRVVSTIGEKVLEPLDNSFNVAADFYQATLPQVVDPVAREMLYNLFAVTTFAAPHALVGAGKRIHTEKRLRTELRDLQTELQEHAAAGNAEGYKQTLNNMLDKVAPLIGEGERVPEGVKAVKEWIDKNAETLLDETTKRVDDETTAKESVNYGEAELNVGEHDAWTDERAHKRMTLDKDMQEHHTAIVEELNMDADIAEVWLGNNDGTLISAEDAAANRKIAERTAQLEEQKQKARTQYAPDERFYMTDAMMQTRALYKDGLKYDFPTDPNGNMFFGEGPIKYTEPLKDAAHLFDDLYKALGLEGELRIFDAESAKYDADLNNLVREAQEANAAGATRVTENGLDVFLGDVSWLQETGVSAKRAKTIAIKAVTHELGHVIDVLGQNFLARHGEIISKAYERYVKRQKGTLTQAEWFAEQVSDWIRNNKKPFTSYQRILHKAAKIWKTSIQWVVDKVAEHPKPLKSREIAAILDERRKQVAEAREVIPSTTVVKAAVEYAKKPKAEGPIPHAAIIVRDKLLDNGMNKNHADKLAADYNRAVELDLINKDLAEDLPPAKRRLQADAANEVGRTNGDIGWETSSKEVLDLIDVMHRAKTDGMKKLLKASADKIGKRAPKRDRLNLVLNEKGNPQTYTSKKSAQQAADVITRKEGQFVVPAKQGSRWVLSKEKPKGTTFFMPIPKDPSATITGGVEHWKKVVEGAKKANSSLHEFLRDTVGLDRGQAVQTAKYIERRIKDFDELLPIDAGLLDLPDQTGPIVAHAGHVKGFRQKMGEIVGGSNPKRAKKYARLKKEAPEGALGVHESAIKSLVTNIKEQYKGKADMSNIRDIRQWGRAFETAPEMFRSMFGQWGLDYFWHPRVHAEAAMLKRTKFYVNQLREWEVMTGMPKDGWTRMIQYAYTKRNGGKQRLQHMGLDPLSWEQLSPHEQGAYDMCNRMLQDLWPLINETRVKCGKKPLKMDESGSDYFTFLGRIADPGTLSNILGAAKDPKSVWNMTWSQALEHSQKLYPNSKVLKRIGKIRERSYEKRYQPDSMNERVVYETNGRKIMEIYIASVMREAHLAPLFAVHTATIHSAFKPSDFKFLEGVETTKNPVPNRGDAATRRKLRKEIRATQEWQKGDTGYAEKISREDKMREVYGSGRLRDLTVDQLRNYRDHLVQNAEMKNSPVEYFETPFSFKDEWTQASYAINSWLIETYEQGLGRVLRADKYMLPAIEEGLYQFSRKISGAYVIGSGTTAIVQTSAILPALIKGGHTSLRGILKTFSTDHARFAIQNSDHLQLRLGGNAWDAILEDFGFSFRDAGTIDKINRIGSVGMQAVDGVVAISAWHMGYEKAKSLGLKDRAAFKYADDFVVSTQGSGLRTDVSPIQRKKLGKVVTALQTFTIAQANFIWRDIFGVGRKMSAWERGWKIASFIAGTSLINNQFQKYGLHPPFPDVAYALYQSLEEEDDSAPAAIWKAIKEGAEFVPILSSTRYSGPSGWSGVVTSDITKIWTAISEAPDTWENSDDILDFLAELATSPEGRAILRTQGVGFIDQLMRIGRSWREGYESFGEYITGRENDYEGW